MLEKTKNLITAIILKIVLDIICVSYLCEVYGKFSFDIDLSFSKIFQSYLLLSLIVVLMPISKKNISSLIIWLFITITYIPSLTIYGLGNESSVWILYTTLFWLSVYGILFLYKPSLEQLSKAHKKNNQSLKYPESLVIFDQRVWFCILFVLGYTFLSIATLPNIKFALDFTDIYDVRSSFKPILPFAGYLLTWAIFVINPLLIVYFGILQKNIKLTILSCASQFFLYIGNGQKTTLFSIPVILILIFYWSKGKVSFYSICLSITGILVGGALSFLYGGDILSSALFASRTLILPAITNFYYYDFFYKHPPLLLAHGGLGLFFPYKFPMLPWYVIGQAYFSNPDVSVNCGMLGDSYMNFKEFGLIFNSFVFSILLIYVDRVGLKKNQPLVLSCTLMPFIWCLNGSLFSVFATGGMGIGLLLVSRISEK